MTDSKLNNEQYLQVLCKAIKRIGIGDFWYKSPNEYSFGYKSYHIILSILFYILTILEGLEAIFNTYPSDIHNDSMALSVAHAVIIIRLHLLLHNKEKIKLLIKEIIEVCKEYETDDVIINQYKRLKHAVIFQMAAVFPGTLFYLFEGIRRKYVEDFPFIILGLYYPKYEDVSTQAFCARIVIYLILVWFMFFMIAADTLAVSHLVILFNKFITLRKYFNNILKKANNAEEMRKLCLKGIVMHQKLISMSDKIYSSFGATMSLQVCQTSVVAVLLLLRITFTSHLAVTNLSTNICFLSALLIQLALYLWNAGEITYQASLLSTAIFHCGWENYISKESNGRNLRALVQMGCAQAQKPLIMKAFGIQDLSYETFVSVIRMSYSIFAVMRTRA